MENLKKYIDEINNFPREGIVFKDLNPIYKEPKRWNELMLPLQKLISYTKPDYIAGIEARGFITESALAFKHEFGFIPIRKPKKLPGKVIGVNYKLEYGVDRLEIQKHSIEENSKVLVIDDLLATGGTACAAGKLIKESKAKLIGYAFLVELTKLKGRQSLDPNLFLPRSFVSSTIKAYPIKLPPASLINLPAALAVPPVASKSSIIKILLFFSNKSSWISNLSSPYSSL